MAKMSMVLELKDQNQQDTEIGKEKVDVMIFN